MLGTFVMVRNKESGRMWVYDERVWLKMQEQGTTDFEAVTVSDDYESLRSMTKLTNYDMDKELFDDIRKGEL
jgi:hypothetical protein